MNIPGHGIAEHKNIYGTETLVGNWREDRYGEYLKTNQRVFHSDWKTDYTGNFIPPNKMDDKQTRNAPEQPPISKGLPLYALIGHGDRGPIDPEPLDYVSMSEATLQGRMRTDQILAFRPNVVIDVDKPTHMLMRTKEHSRYVHDDHSMYQTTAHIALSTTAQLSKPEPAPTRVAKSTHLFAKEENQQDYILPVRRSSQFTDSFRKCATRQ